MKIYENRFLIIYSYNDWSSKLCFRLRTTYFSMTPDYRIARTSLLGIGFLNNVRWLLHEHSYLTTYVRLHVCVRLMTQHQLRSTHHSGTYITNPKTREWYEGRVYVCRMHWVSLAFTHDHLKDEKQGKSNRKRNFII
jgi:hypothetical protein